MKYETTIRSAVEFTGIGLHTGVFGHLRILPAPAGTGIVFRRSDLDAFEVEAVFGNLATVAYATSFMKQGVLISSTQHLLSAFAGVGVDNAIVELDTIEIPILDGSARPFVESILKAGLQQQTRRRSYLKILRPYEVTEGNQFIGIYPAECYSVSCVINFPHPLVGVEHYRMDFSTCDYVQEIAPARTFGLIDEQNALRDKGLIRGRSRENCILLTSEGIDNPPLRYPDEFVRHEVLDLIGDLSLLGKPIVGHVEANRASRAFRMAMIGRIQSDESYFEEVALVDDASPANEDFTITFDPRLAPGAIQAALSALADYYRACGGAGLRIADTDIRGSRGVDAWQTIGTPRSVY
jgi:UDP-3-O-[3-hydroxymyristoyl] N-acetylglucosamine deacetylase